MTAVMICRRALIISLFLSTCFAYSVQNVESGPKARQLVGRQDDNQGDDDGPIPLEDLSVILGSRPLYLMSTNVIDTLFPDLPTRTMHLRNGMTGTHCLEFPKANPR